MFLVEVVRDPLVPLVQLDPVEQSFPARQERVLLVGQVVGLEHFELERDLEAVAKLTAVAPARADQDLAALR